MKTSRALTWLGVAISVVGLVALIWIQGDDAYSHSAAVTFRYSAAYRLQLAIGPIAIIGAGALLAVTAQIMEALQTIVRRLESN